MKCSACYPANRVRYGPAGTDQDSRVVGGPNSIAKRPFTDGRPSAVQRTFVLSIMVILIRELSRELP